jgi:peptidoglycan L-alanyl-D-glutamate endopeptidase CwlK
MSDPLLIAIEELKFIQTELRDAGFYSGDIDGKFRKISRAALAKALEAARRPVAAAPAPTPPAPPPPARDSGFRFSQRSLDRARNVDSRLIGLAITALSRSSVDFGLTEEQSRTEAEQAEKVRRGVSRTMNSKHMIPKGKTVSSALDLVPYVDGVFTWGDNQWRVKTKAGPTIEPFYEIAAQMREAAIAAGLVLTWGGVWDRRLNDLPAGAAAMKAAVQAYAARRKAAGGTALLDGPHFELA